MSSAFSLEQVVCRHFMSADDTVY